MLLSIRWEALSCDRGVYQNTTGKKKNRKDRFYSEKDQLSINVKKYIFMTIIVVIRMSNYKRIVLY